MIDTANIVNAAGLVFDIAGAVLIFIYGLPKWIPRDNEQLIVDGGNISDPKPETKLDSYTRNNRIGLVFLITGFLLQLISDFIK
jgi:hypothetical protein